ncbi:unnamed protein product [Miscanthus lutarioriparius]|uniref:Uncharacterized protein n=1 Tax=Miscanthus lutarioriparius TaxID=422564 RepID=A0A811S5B8_9POAL|nr:unnamed protein product [Miscanthus lutarioriparius]
MLLSDWYHENVYAQAAGLDGKDKHWEWVGEPEGHVKRDINHVTLSLPATPYLGAYFYGIEDIAFDSSAESQDSYDRDYDVQKPRGAQTPEASSPTTNANALEEGVSESHPCGTCTATTSGCSAAATASTTMPGTPRRSTR